jgi:AbrB family looped-hinge helix DNA binding protein
MGGYDMKTTVDAAGRLVIPKAIREQAGLKPGAALEIRWNGDFIEIEAATLPVRLVQEGRFLVAVPEIEVPELTADVVEETRQSLHGNPGA